MAYIKYYSEILDKLFGDEVIIRQSEIIKNLPTSDLGQFFPDMSNKDIGHFNPLFKFNYLEAYKAPESWIVNINNLKNTVKVIIFDEFGEGTHTIGDIYESIENYFVTNYFRKPLKDIIVIPISVFFNSLLKDVFKTLLISDKSFSFDGNISSHDWESFVCSMIKISGQQQTDIIDEVIKILLESPEEKRSLRSLLFKLNSSPNEFLGYPKPITIRTLNQIIFDNSQQLGAVLHNDAVKLENHPRVIWGKLSDNRLSYFDLLEYFEQFKSEGLHYIGIWVTDVNIFGTEFYEYVNGLPLIYLLSTKDIRNLFSIQDLFSLKSKNDFIINLMTLAYEQSLSSKTDFYHRFPLKDGYPDAKSINEAFTFGVYSVAGSSQKDFSTTLIETYFPLLNYSKTPKHPYYETLSEIREKHTTLILSD